MVLHCRRRSFRLSLFLVLLFFSISNYCKDPATSVAIRLPNCYSCEYVAISASSVSAHTNKLTPRQICPPRTLILK
jgi:hypothetical protein